MKSRAEQGLPTPSWDNRPLLFADLEEVWEVFSRLNRSRSPAFEGLAPFAVSDIVAMMDLKGISGRDRREEFSVLVAHADATWRRLTYENRPPHEKT